VIRRGGRLALAPVAFAVALVSPASQQPAVTVSATVDVWTARGVGSFTPDQALGGGLDGRDRGEIRSIYTRANLRAMDSAGLRPATYRLRTELAVEAWHWAREGRWSDPTHHQGYWASADLPPARDTAPVSNGYRLPRRGNTIDQANDDGYSRLDDGSRASFWKSNPYLDPRLTREPEARHAQWVLVDFGHPKAVDTLRLAWGTPFARHVRVQRWHGREAIMQAGARPGYWVDFPHAVFASRGGIQTLRLAGPPVAARFVRVLLTQSSHTAPRGSRDLRDRLGFAVRELWLGRQERGTLRDLVRHRPEGSKQTVTFTSSTDPWHRARDRDLHTEQPSFVRFRSTGLTHGLPVLVPVPVLYGTPEDAVAELRHLQRLGIPLRGVELGEEPDGQLITPEDYGALYVQFARAIRRAFPHLPLGGPGFQTSIPDWVAWPDARGDRSWTRRFLAELRRRHAMSLLNFFAFEWYPFDNGCRPPAGQLAAQPRLLADILRRQAQEGLPRGIPRIITEFGYSAFATRHEVDRQGALMNADIVGTFLSHGGSAAYLYGYEPDALIRELNCHSWGNLVLFQSDDNHRILRPVATYWETRLLTREWAEPGGGRHVVLRTDVTGPRDAASQPLVTAYAVRRPDGRVAVMVLNKDRRRTLRVRIRLRPGEATLAGPLRVFQLSAATYVWHAHREHGFARPDRAPLVSTVSGSSPELTLPPVSLTVVRSVPG
jgi:hypothetical protein